MTIHPDVIWKTDCVHATDHKVILFFTLFLKP